MTNSSFRLLHKSNPCYQHFTHREVHPVRRRAPPAVPAAAAQGRELRVAPVGHLRILPGSDPHADALHRHLGSPEISHSRCRGLMRCQYWPSFSTCNPPATAPAAVVGREGRHHVVVSGVARHGGLPARGRRRRHGEGGAAAQAVLLLLLLLLLLVWLAMLPQVLRVQVDSGKVQYFGVHQWSLKLKRRRNRIRIGTDIDPKIIE